jgi:antitoxin (DNA-binding transcriptional repressor) of toxin-antitoxin stability system
VQQRTSPCYTPPHAVTTSNRAVRPPRPPPGYRALALITAATRLQSNYPAAGPAAYPGDVTAAHAFELPPDSEVPAAAVDAAEHGQVVYLTRKGKRIAAIVPTAIAAAGAAAAEALEDAEDVAAAAEALAEGGELIPAEQVWAELGL